MTSDPTRSDRRLRWVSSVTGDPTILTILDGQMGAFYGRMDKRAHYQAMLDTQEVNPLSAGTVGDRMVNDIIRSRARTVLEVGCGNGWIYRHLRRAEFAGVYTGLEMSEALIGRNRARQPEARWEVGSGYAIPVPDRSTDACFAFYVLEHTVYPERMLAEMLRVTVQGGMVYLAFPDFCAVGYIPSQLTGLTPGNAREKQARGRYLDAALTLFDSRVRVRQAIRKAASRCGPFPVNTRPLCLDHPDLMWPDIDAVYLTDKREVASWLRARRCEVDFPFGTIGEFVLHTYIRARTPIG